MELFHLTGGSTLLLKVTPDRWAVSICIVFTLCVAMDTCVSVVAGYITYARSVLTTTCENLLIKLLM